MLIIYNIFILYNSLYMNKLQNLFIGIFICLLFNSTYIYNKTHKQLILLILLLIVYNSHNCNKEKYGVAGGVVRNIVKAQFAAVIPRIHINKIQLKQDNPNEILVGQFGRHGIKLYFYNYNKKKIIEKEVQVKHGILKTFSNIKEYDINSIPDNLKLIKYSVIEFNKAVKFAQNYMNTQWTKLQPTISTLGTYIDSGYFYKNKQLKELANNIYLYDGYEVSEPLLLYIMVIEKVLNKGSLYQTKKYYKDVENGMIINIIGHNGDLISTVDDYATNNKTVTKQNINNTSIPLITEIYKNNELMSRTEYDQISKTSTNTFKSKNLKVDNTQINFIPPKQTLNISCPKNYDLFVENLTENCINKEDTNKICRLDINGNKDYPICETVPCPTNYNLENGICINNNNHQCALDPYNTKGLDMCDGYNDYFPVKNKDIKNNTLEYHPDISATVCSHKCNKNPRCSSFIMTTDNKHINCELKKKPNKKSLIKNNKNKITYWKNPIKYTMDYNTEIKAETIESFKNTSPTECANKCDENDDCERFVYNTKTLDCNLKSSVDENSPIENIETISFNSIQKKGQLCDNINIDDLQDELQDETSTINYKFEDKLKKHKDELKLDKTIKLRDVQKDVNSVIIENLIDENIFIWENIDCYGILIKIENLKGNTMKFNNIQMWGNNSNNKYINLLIDEKHIIKDSVSDSISTDDISELQFETDIRNIYDNNLETSHSIYRNSENKSYLTIKYDKLVHIDKIIISNENNYNNYPLKISILNNKNFIEKSFIKKTISSVPTIIDNYKIKTTNYVQDKGIPNTFMSHANITGRDGKKDYCRFIKNNKSFCCAFNNSPNEYTTCVSADKIKTLNNKSYFFNENPKTKLDELCWCDINSTNSNIKCLENNDSIFGDSYTLKSNNINCASLTGDEIKKQLINDDSYENNSITAGFYWGHTNKYYLFKNTVLNNKNIILYTKIDATTNKLDAGFPKIVNEKTWGNLSILDKISSILYDGHNHIYIIKDNIYIKFNLIKNEQLPNYPKKLDINWRIYNNIFYKNINNSIYLNKTNSILFNGLKLIQFDMNIIENKQYNKGLNENIIYDISQIFTNIKNIIYDCIIYNYDSNNCIFFYKNKYIIYDYLNQKNMYENSIKNQWNNIWKIDINNI